MAKQQGMVNVRGTVGDITYRRTKDGFKVGLKSNLTSESMRNDIRFDNTRRANTEFGAAGKAGKLIRTAINQQLDFAGDGRLNQRMIKTLMQVVKSDTQSDFGLRRPEKGVLGFLEGLEFNLDTEMQHAFLVPYVTSIDRGAGKLEISVPVFTASNMLRVPPGASHFNLVSAGTALDFENTKYETGISESAYFPVTNTQVNGFSLSNIIGTGSILPLVLVLGIRFYKEVNGKYYRLNGGEFNALRIVAVDQV